MFNEIWWLLENVWNFIVRRKVLFIFVCVLFAIFMLNKVQPDAMDQAVGHLTVIKNRIVNMTRDGRLLENILRASYKPRYNGKTIFFIESHTKTDKVLGLFNRQACSIEAAGELFFNDSSLT